MSTAPMSIGEQTGVVTVRRLRALAGADQLRLLGTALLVFLLFDFVRLTVFDPPTDAEVPLVVMDALAYLAMMIALWRPRLGLGIAAIPLAVALFWTSTGMDALLLTVVPALALAQLDRRSAGWVSLALAGYVGVRVLVYAGDQRGLLALTLGASLAGGAALGWVALVIRERRERAALSAARRAAENARIRAEERRTLSRELHDVVTHQLSTAALQLMSARTSADPAVLARVLSVVDRATAEALNELRLLADVLRDDPATSASGTEIRELSERVPPTRSAAAAELALVEHGFEPEIRVPAAADDVEMTVQRTLSRVIDEAVANVIRHAPPKSRCIVDVRITDQHASVEVRNPVPSGMTAPPPGRGLRGLAARISLTGGSFTADVADAEWLVLAQFPRH
ncbi:MAG: histidine kinase [Micropruina sp.]|uniref:sensor histidine kinase n=1 Tax=Micropruina sp. TaxID=2737536 RepID=UPI0039E3F74D